MILYYFWREYASVHCVFTGYRFQEAEINLNKWSLLTSAGEEIPSDQQPTQLDL